LIQYKGHVVHKVPNNGRPHSGSYEPQKDVQVLVQALIDIILRQQVTGDWRRLRNEELHNLYASQHIIRTFGWDGACRTHGGDEKSLKNSDTNT